MAHELDQQLLNELRDRLFAAFEEHERTEHGGGPCNGHRVGVVAWFCHLLNVRDFEQVRINLEDFDFEHTRLHGREVTDEPPL